MDDELDEAPRLRRERPKDSFQNELQSKLRQRKFQGKSVDISDSDDNLSDPLKDFKTTHSKRPSAPKRRQRQYADLTEGLGTQTMRAKDLSRMLNHSLSDDDDEEIVAANLGKTNSRESLHSSGLKTPSPKQESKYLRKSARKSQPEKFEPGFGRTASTEEVSSHSSLSKEDIIFGRRTPTTVDGKKRSLKDLLGEDIDKEWQPPRFRNASPRDTEYNRGSRGVSPIDSSLDMISESPSEKVTPRFKRRDKYKDDELSSQHNKPKPQVRSKVGESKTPPFDEHYRKSPLYQMEDEGGMKRTTPTHDMKRTTPTHDMKRTTPTHDMKRTTPTHDMKRTTPTHDMKRTTPTHDTKRTTPTHDTKRTTPTLDIFGQSRSAAAQEVEEYLGGSSKGKDQKEKKTPTSRTQTPEFKRGSGSRDKTPEKLTTVKFAMDDKKTKIGRKTPTDLSGKKSPQDKKSLDKEVILATQESSLLDFLMDDSTGKKPKPQERGRRPRGKENLDTMEDIFGNFQKVNSMEGQKSPRTTGRKTPESIRKSPATVKKQEDTLATLPTQQRAEDTSSLCDDIPPDPNRKLTQQDGRKQTTERAQADNIIETIALAQTMKYIEPAKRIRPRTASAKVQHRPKPRYGALTGNNSKSLQERQFSSTGDIREAIYEEWYKEHLCSARQRKREEEKKAKEEEEKKKKDAAEKHHEGEASYKAWMEKKKQTLLEEHRNKEKMEKMAKAKEEREKKDKQENSQKLFETWKAKKTEVIKQELHKKNEEAKKAEEEKKRKKTEKLRERESAHKSWVNKKEKQHTAEVKEKKHEKKDKRSKVELEKEELRNRGESAENLYFQWLQKKEKQAKLDKMRTRQKSEEEEFKPAWSPASHTIPFGR